MAEHPSHVREAHGEHAHPEHAHAEHAEHAQDRHHGHDGHGDHGGHGDHAAQFRDRFWLSLVLTVPVVAFSHMVGDWFGYVPPEQTEWVPPVLGTVVFLYGGQPFLTGAVSEVRSRRPGMMLLVSLAITVAFVASAATTLGIGDVDLDFWWELALLVVIMLLGHWLEMRALGQASNALDALAALLPDVAERIAADGTTVEVTLDELATGDVVLVRSGGRVPADGVVVDGSAEVDESMISGESRTVPKSVGDDVVAGTVATDSALRLRVEAVGEDTALAGIRRLVDEAQRSGSRAQALADRAAALLFYFATAVGVVTFVVWSLVGDAADAVERTVTVLVIACPHALGLAIPLVVAISTAVSARAGILVKDRLALERMRTIDTVLFDKTGTLTKGTPVVVGVAATDGPGEVGHGARDGGRDAATDRVLLLAAAVEADSEHPVARAITSAAESVGAPPAATDFRSMTGRGVRAVVDGRQVSVGGPNLLRELGLTVPATLAPQVEEWSGHGASVLYVVEHTPGDLGGTSRPVAEPGSSAKITDGIPSSDGTPSSGGDPGGPGDDAGGEVVGAVALADEVRPESRTAVDELHELDVRVVLITGDARSVAESVAAELGVDEVFADVLPQDKASKVAELQARGLHVAMVGDGVNDAPALARADVGIAIGAGTDVAIESAGVVLVSDDPRGVLGAMTLSRASYRKMLQNLLWAAGYNVVAVPLAAGVLASVGFVLAPAVGAILMSASTIVVALNAQLLRRLDLSRDSAPPEQPTRTSPTEPATQRD